MAEELRFFLRTAVWVVGAGAVYWIVSSESAGTTLLAFLLAGIVTLIGGGIAFARSAATRVDAGGRGPLGTVGRVVGFTESPSAEPPFRARSELVPLASAWPIVVAAGMVLAGLGLVFGAWLLIPGVVLAAVAAVGWLTQLDRA